MPRSSLKILICKLCGKMVAEIFKYFRFHFTFDSFQKQHSTHWNEQSICFRKKWQVNTERIQMKWMTTQKNKTIHFIYYMVNIRGHIRCTIALNLSSSENFLTSLSCVRVCVCVWLVSQPFLFNVCLNTSLHKLLVQYHIQVKRLRRMHKNSIYYAWSTGWN